MTIPDWFGRRNRKGEIVDGPVVWMRTNEAPGELPPTHKGDRCTYCKGPLAAEPIPHGTLQGYAIARCDACDVWMNYENSSGGNPP